jgi:hypothetical protein
MPAKGTQTCHSLFVGSTVLQVKEVGLMMPLRREAWLKQLDMYHRRQPEASDWRGGSYRLVIALPSHELGSDQGA